MITRILEWLHGLLCGCHGFDDINDEGW